MSRLVELSEREREVVLLAANGYSDRRIAEELGIGLGTVRTYWSRLRPKLQANSRAHIVAVFTKMHAGGTAVDVDSPNHSGADLEVALGRFGGQLAGLLQTAAWLGLAGTKEIAYLSESCNEFFRMSADDLNDGPEGWIDLLAPNDADSVRRAWGRLEPSRPSEFLTLNWADPRNGGSFELLLHPIDDETLPWRSHIAFVVPRPNGGRTLPPDVVQRILTAGFNA